MRLKTRLFLASWALLAGTLSAQADTLIVGNKYEHTISFIDLDTGLEIIRQETGQAPHEIAVSPDGKLAVVVSYRAQSYIGNSLHVFDIAKGEKVRHISLGKHTAPHGLKWVKNSRTVAVTTEGSKHLLIVNVDTGEIKAEIPTTQSGSHMVAISPDERFAYVANIRSGSFTIIDLVSAQKVKTIRAGRGTEAISVTPDGSEIWVGNNNSKSVMVFTQNGEKKLATINTEGVPIRVEISPDGKFAAVSEANLNRISIYDVRTRKKVTDIDLAQIGANVPVTLLFSPGGDFLWVATTRSAKVTEIDVANWSIIRSFEAGQGSDGLGYSPLKTTP